MNNNKLNIDNYTRELVKKGGLEQPNANFTKDVMSRILKDPSVKLNFVSKDDKQSNIWLFISIGAMILGYSIFYFIKNGFNFSSVETPGFLKVFMGFFSNLFNELSLSPYILLAVVGVVVLVVLDKTIVRYLYSI